MQFPADEDTAVFYNPVQVQNRDLSILMITLHAEQRHAKEVEKWANRNARRATTKTTTTTTATTPMAAVTCDQTIDHATNHSDVENNAMTKNGDEDSIIPGLCILDALAASGLRSMRYWKECPYVHHITINDLDPAARERAFANLEHNGLTEHFIDNVSVLAETATDLPRPKGIGIQTGDATDVMYNCRQRNRQRNNLPILPSTTKQQWDVIDLDPYGSAAPFLDAAIQSIANGGLLNVTCTDMAALGGSHPETCFGRYGCMPLTRSGYLQELALRILLHTLATTAARYGRSIRPLLSVGMDFYVRVFVEVQDDKAGVQDLSLMVGNVYQSTQCPSFYLGRSGQMGGKKNNVYQPGRLPLCGKCEETGGFLKVGGPLWMGPLHDHEMLKQGMERLKATPNGSSRPDTQYLATKDRLRGLLRSCYEELPDCPLFYRLPDLSQCLHLSTPPLVDIQSALVNAGYRVSGYHKDPVAIKTNAPVKVLWDVLRAWAQRHPPAHPPKEGTVAHQILSKPIESSIDFAPASSVLDARRDLDVKRFPQNPQANWGPKRAASGKKRKAEDTNEE